METQGVYVDVLLAINFMADYLLLATVQLLCRRQILRKRLALAALLGSLGSLCIFLPPFSTAVQWLGKLLLSGLMIRISSPWKGWRGFLCAWIGLFGATFLYGGAMLALRMTVGKGWMLCANGVVYFHIKPLTLVLDLGLGFALVRLFQRLFPSPSLDSAVYDVELEVQGKKISGRGLMDTGNHLTEPFSGYPVVVMERRNFPGTILEKGFRLIPCKTVSGSGLLPAVRGDWLRLNGEENMVMEQFYVALTEEPIGDGSYQLLLSGGLGNSK